MSTYAKTYYKAISTEQSNRISGYIKCALALNDNFQVEKFFTPLLSSLKNGHRYLVFGCTNQEGDLRLVKLNAYFQHPSRYDVGELIEINGDITELFSLPNGFDDNVKQKIEYAYIEYYEDAGVYEIESKNNVNSENIVLNNIINFVSITYICTCKTMFNTLFKR